MSDALSGHIWALVAFVVNLPKKANPQEAYKVTFTGRSRKVEKTGKEGDIKFSGFGTMVTVHFSR